MSSFSCTKAKIHMIPNLQNNCLNIEEKTEEELTETFFEGFSKILHGDKQNDFFQEIEIPSIPKNTYPEKPQILNQGNTFFLQSSSIQYNFFQKNQIERNIFKTEIKKEPMNFRNINQNYPERRKSQSKSRFIVKAYYRNSLTEFSEDEIIPTKGFYSWKKNNKSKNQFQKEIRVCPFFKKAHCHFGKGCYDLHLKKNVYNQLEKQFLNSKRKRPSYIERNDIIYPPTKRQKKIKIPKTSNVPKPSKEKIEEKKIIFDSILAEQEHIFSIKSIRIQISGRLDSPFIKQLRYGDRYSFLVVNWLDPFEFENNDVTFERKEKVIVKKAEFPPHNGAKVLLFKFDQNELCFP